MLEGVSYYQCRLWDNFNEIPIKWTELRATVVQSTDSIIVVDYYFVLAIPSRVILVLMLTHSTQRQTLQTALIITSNK